MFCRRNYRRRIQGIICFSALVSLVFIFIHNSAKITSVTEPDTVSTIKAPLTDLLRERAASSRKVLAEYGLTLPTARDTYRHILIVSTGRSGSTLTGELLSQLPGALYNYEPLMYFDHLDPELHGNRYITELTEMLKCNYGPLFQQFQGIDQEKFRLLQSNAAYLACRDVEDKNYCENPRHLSQVCQYFPIQVSKIVRTSLNNILNVVRKSEPNLHTILLVRDSRATIASLRAKSWCNYYCTKPEKLCDLLRSNYEKALVMAKEFPGRFTVIRYEDIATEPEARFRELLQRLGIPVTPSVADYIKKHTNTQIHDHGNTFRRRGSRVAAWKDSLPWKDVQEIQSACSDVFSMYGYLPILALNDTLTFDTEWKFRATMK